jgi:hypothetical protein
MTVEAHVTVKVTKAAIRAAVTGIENGSETICPPSPAA